MSDASMLPGWTPRFREWAEKCAPLFAEGKPKEAFAQYPWVQTEGEPFARLEKPASESRFGLITTGGYSAAGQEPFTGLPDFGDTPPDVHVIPMDVDRGSLRIDHFGYDHRFAKEDINVNLPFDRLREMVDDGELGSVSNDSLVLMGLIPNAAALIEGTIPRIVEKLRSDSVEGALLVPS